MFKVTSMGAVEGMKCFALTGTSNLRRYLIDHLDTVELAAAAGMPTCDVMVSQEPRGAILRARMRVPNPYCREEVLQTDLTFERWREASAGEFGFLWDALMQAALKLVIGTPAFYHTRITQYKRLYLYTFSKEVRTVLRECYAAYQERPLEGLPPMNEIFKREDLCLMLQRKGADYVLSCVSDEEELLLGAYAEEGLFKPGESTESLLWRYFNEYMRDVYRVKVSSVLVLKFGSKLRVK